MHFDQNVNVSIINIFLFFVFCCRHVCVSIESNGKASFKKKKKISGGEFFNFMFTQGKFCAKVISIYPLAQVEQDIIQTDIEMVKMNRYQEGVQGCMNITRSVGPVSVSKKNSYRQR